MARLRERYRAEAPAAFGRGARLRPRVVSSRARDAAEVARSAQIEGLDRAQRDAYRRFEVPRRCAALASSRSFRPAVFARRGRRRCSAGSSARLTRELFELVRSFAELRHFVLVCSSNRLLCLSERLAVPRTKRSF